MFAGFKIDLDKNDFKKFDAYEVGQALYDGYEGLSEKCW